MSGHFQIAVLKTTLFSSSRQERVRNCCKCQLPETLWNTGLSEGHVAFFTEAIQRSKNENYSKNVGQRFFFFPSSCYHCRLNLFTNILPSDVHHKGVRSSHILHSSEHTIGNKCIVKKCKSGTITNKQQGIFFFLCLFTKILLRQQYSTTLYLLPLASVEEVIQFHLIRKQHHLFQGKMSFRIL